MKNDSQINRQAGTQADPYVYLITIEAPEDQTGDSIDIVNTLNTLLTNNTWSNFLWTMTESSTTDSTNDDFIMTNEEIFSFTNAVEYKNQTINTSANEYYAIFEGMYLLDNQDNPSQQIQLKTKQIRINFLVTHVNESPIINEPDTECLMFWGPRNEEFIKFNVEDRDLSLGVGEELTFEILPGDYSNWFELSKTSMTDENNPYLVYKGIQDSYVYTIDSPLGAGDKNIAHSSNLLPLTITLRIKVTDKGTHSIEFNVVLTLKPTSIVKGNITF